MINRCNKSFSQVSENFNKSASSNSDLPDKIQKLRFLEKGPVVEEFGDTSSSGSNQAEPRRLSRKKKSKFCKKDKIESMEVVNPSCNTPLLKPKREVRYDSGVGSQQFLKGGNTVSLVSSLVDHTIRNTNMMEIYERFKFLSKECFRTQGKEIFLFKMVLNEVDLYLKSYDEDEEDSGWDSDQEVGVISIAKKLKNAIEDKLELFEQLDEVERNLFESNMSSIIERNSSVSSSHREANGSGSKNNKEGSFRTEETCNTKEDNLELIPDCDQSNLYKNVLKKINTEAGSKKEPLSPAINLNFFDSDSTVAQKDDDSLNTPTGSKKSVYKSRMAQRVSSSTFYAPRSSSIQSIRSNKSNITHKKTKKSDKKHQKQIRIFPKRKVSFSSESESESNSCSRTSSPSSALIISEIHPKMSSNDSKPAKGLSKFANKKSMKKSRKGGLSRLAKMKGFKTKKEKIEKKEKLQISQPKDDVSSNNDSNNNILAPLEEVSEVDSPYVGNNTNQFINFSEKEEVKQMPLHMREVSIPIPLDKIKSGPENLMKYQEIEKSLDENAELGLPIPKTVLSRVNETDESSAMNSATGAKSLIKKNLDSNIYTPKVAFTSQLADPKARMINKRKTIFKVDTFNSIFDSFGSEQIQAISPKRRGNSIVMLSARNSSSVALPTLEKDVKLTRRRSLSHDKGTPKISKNRSKSLVLTKTTKHTTKPRRVMSDFHELLNVRAKVTIGFLRCHPENLEKTQEEKQEKSEKSEENISENESVSEEDSSSNDSVFCEDHKSLVRFYSLPILPSEKD